MRIKIDGKNIDIDIRRKHIKNIILRVYPDGNVAVSAPFSMPMGSISNFVKAKEGWIQKQLDRLAGKAAPESGCLFLLGQQRQVTLRPASKNNVEVLDDEIVIHAKNPGGWQAVLDGWWKKEAYAYYMLYVKKWMPLFSELGADMPRVSVRKMKSMWGSCTTKKGAIRLNYYLFCTLPACVEYVVFHELAHLLYPNHGDRFKAFLTKHMPDWKQRKAMLSSSRLDVTGPLPVDV